MARPIEYVRSEILRVAEDFGVHPRSAAFTRKMFLDNTDVTKHDLEVYAGFSLLKQDAANLLGIESVKDLKEISGMQLRNNYAKLLERKIGRSDYFSDKLQYCIADVFEKNPIKLSPGKIKSNKKFTSRMITILLSDLHFGVDVDPREVLKSEYNWNIATRRLAKICVQLAEYKLKHRDETELQVVLNGDIIHGVIHLTEANLRPLTEQIYGATAILTKVLDFLRNNYKKVRVLCLPGNHDRVTYKSTDRAVSQRWDSHSHAVYLGLRQAFRQDEGIQFAIPMAGFGTYETPGGHLVFASHGDVEPSVGNVGKVLDVGKLTSNLLKMNAGNPFDKKVEVALFGHWHQPSLWMLQDGTYCIVNGSTLGSDTYAQNAVGFFNSMPAQVMFESVPGYPVGDYRIIQLRDADTDDSYDKILKPPGLAGGLDFD